MHQLWLSTKCYRKEKLEDKIGRVASNLKPFFAMIS